MLLNHMPTSPLTYPCWASLSASGGLSAAVSENLFALFRAMASLPGGSIIEGERFCCHHAPLANPFFHGAWRARLGEEEVDDAIDEAMTWFTERGAASFCWWTDAQTQPPGLALRLLNRGFVGSLVGEIGMAVDLSQLNQAQRPPQGLTIVRALDPQAQADWETVYAAAFGEPQPARQVWVHAWRDLPPGDNAPWQPYTAYLNGKAVAASLLFKGAGTAGLYAVGTLPEARGRGIGTAVTLKPLQDAREQGYQVGVLFASHMGYPVYRRLGFHEVANPIGIYQYRLNL